MMAERKNLILRRREAPSRRTRIVIQPLAGTAKSLLLIRFGQHFGEQRALDIAAGLDQRDPLAGEARSLLQCRRERRGYQAIHGDRELVYRGDPDTGLPMTPETGTPTAIWMSEHQIWDVEKVKAYIANQNEAVTFFCGGSRNFAKFIDLFDGVFVLEVDLDTMNRRIDERVALDPTDFGGKPEERELAVRLRQTKEDIPKNGIIIDATAPLARVVDEILCKCR